MDVAKLIKEKRISLGLTMKQVADRVGVSESAVCRWETGDISNMKRDKIANLAKVLSISPLALLGVDDIIPLDTIRSIPIMGRISAGMPILAEENIEGYTTTDLNHGGVYFGLRVRGDSMNAARIGDGDVLIVRQQDTVENGQIAVCMVGDDEATVKRFYKSSNTVTLMPQSTNPAHQPQIYDLRQTPVRVIGLVVKIEIRL